MTGRTEEGQSRRIVWEVCPVKRPLLSVAETLRAEIKSTWARTAFVKNNKTGQITNLRRERNVWMLDLWVMKPADAMDVSSFQRLGRCRAGTTVTTVGPVPVRPLLAPVDEESAPGPWSERARISPRARKCRST